MNEKTFNELFPEVELAACPHEIQNFRNSIADISILGQFHTYLEFRGEKCLNTFIVTNVNDCPNLLSYGANFRMGVLLPNYPEENIVKGENVPNSDVIVEKDTGSHHSPNHTIKKKLRISLDPRDLNEALEREPYHTHSVDEITAKLQGMTVFTTVDFRKGYWMVVLHPDSRKLT